MKKYFYFIFFIVFIIGCSNNDISYKIDNTTFIAKGKNQRIQFIIIHYTAGSNESSIKTLISEKVSSHYLILSEKELGKSDNVIYNLVPDNERAWHAGISSFRDKNNLNDVSIGIEIVNDGIDKKFRSIKGYNKYEDYLEFEDNQIKKVAYLIKILKEKYNIPSKNILAHSDIAPSRKRDPGAKFPWKLLYEKYNIGAWYDEEDKNLFMDYGKYLTKTIREIKKEFRNYGYNIDDEENWTKESRDVIYAFQLHFNPKNCSGEMDLETYAILKALNKKYIYIKK